MPHLHREQTVPLPIGDAFRFFEDPQNLKLLTPDWVRLRITDRPVALRAGAEISYSIRWMGLPLRWRTRFAQYDPPHGFTDAQLRGPFKKWEHTHTFVPEGESTRIVDDLEYELPFGALGEIVAGSLIRRQLEALFDYRRKQIETRLS
jgi:ligand-binding SRPBCC domain-containing protein